MRVIEEYEFLKTVAYLIIIFLIVRVILHFGTVILSIAVGAVIAMNFCNYGCLNYRRSLGEALVIDVFKLKNRTNKFRKNPDEQIPKKIRTKKIRTKFPTKKKRKTNSREFGRPIALSSYQTIQGNEHDTIIL